MIAYFAKYGSFFVQGALTTLWMSLGSVICGTLLGIGIALLRTVNKYVGIIGTAYVEYTRGTPLMVQAIIIYYLPALINVNINKYLAGLVAISLNSAAYVAEIIRGGINSVDKGQMEAARSLGMPQGLAMRQVVLPQAIKNILPSLANEFVAVIKESSIISVIASSISQIRTRMT